MATKKALSMPAEVVFVAVPSTPVRAKGPYVPRPAVKSSQTVHRTQEEVRAFNQRMREKQAAAK